MRESKKDVSFSLVWLWMMNLFLDSVTSSQSWKLEAQFRDNDGQSFRNKAVRTSFPWGCGIAGVPLKNPMKMKLQILSYLFPYAFFFQNIGRKGCENQLMAPLKRNLLPPLDPIRSNSPKVMTRAEKRRLRLKTKKQAAPNEFSDLPLLFQAQPQQYMWPAETSQNLGCTWMTYWLDFPFCVYRCLKQGWKGKTSQTSKDLIILGEWGKWSCHTTCH